MRVDGTFHHELAVLFGCVLDAGVERGVLVGLIGASSES